MGLEASIDPDLGAASVALTKANPGLDLILFLVQRPSLLELHNVKSATVIPHRSILHTPLIKYIGRGILNKVVDHLVALISR